MEERGGEERGGEGRGGEGRGGEGRGGEGRGGKGRGGEGRRGEERGGEGRESMKQYTGTLHCYARKSHKLYNNFVFYTFNVPHLSRSRFTA